MSDRSIPGQRRNEILAYLEQNKFVRSTTLSQLLDASEATIRRDLAALENEGLIERSHGGAMVSRVMQNEPEFSASKLTFSIEKERIGAAAAALVQSGETVFMNFGTTVIQAARHIKSRTDLQDVTVITNNLGVLQELQHVPFVQIVVLGGYYRAQSQSMVGNIALKALDGVLSSLAFVGVDGVSLRYGGTTAVENDAEITRQMIENTAGSVVLVADSSKWGVVSKYRVAPLNRFQRWMTDERLPVEAREVLEDIPLRINVL